MRSWLWVLLAIFLCGSLQASFAQDTTTRTGFAVVTLVSGNVAGLIANETLTFQTGAGNEQAIVSPSVLVTGVSMLVTLGPTSLNTTAITLANPSAGSGGVNLLVTDAGGGIILNTIVQLGPRGQFSRFLSELMDTPPAEPVTGLLTVSAEIPVAVLGLNFQGGEFASIPQVSLSFPLAVPVQPLTAQVSTPAVFSAALPAALQPPAPVTIGGAGALVFPQVVSGGGWMTDIAIGNTSSGPQTIRIDFFASTGANVGSLTDITIPSHGVFFFSTTGTTVF